VPGLINGAFYALLSLGLAVIFGLLKIINFAHGVLYMLGAMTTVILFDTLGISYWAALFVALIIQGVLTNIYGVSGLRYAMPDVFKGGMNLGFMFLPYYRAWVIVIALLVCFGTWFMIEKTKLGAYLRAGTEDSQLMQGFGINVPLLVSLT
jgi:branched-chain amino acid transport system permease protein